MSAMSDTDHREVPFASDEVSARVEMLRFGLGEGPCFEAFDSRPMLVPDPAAAHGDLYCRRTGWLPAAESATAPLAR